MGGWFYINLDFESPVRYDEGRFLEWKEDMYDVLNSYFVERIKGLSVAGEYVVVSEEGRPDLLSYNLYGSTQYWWVLLIYNDLINPEDLKSGMTVRYFSVDDLEELFFRLAALERSVGV